MSLMQGVAILAGFGEWSLADATEKGDNELSGSRKRTLLCHKSAEFREEATE